jgi:group I intron endonuclease
VTDGLRLSGVYSIRNKVLGLQYVGSTMVFIRRWNLHKRELKENRHHSRRLQKAWNTHGPDAFEWIILEVVACESLIEREQHWIDFFRSAEPRMGYNIATKAGCPPSPMGLKRSAEMKAKIAASHIGIRPNEEARAKMRAAAAKRIFSDETRARMSAAGKACFRGYNKGKIMSAEQKAKIGAAGKGRRHTEATKQKLREQRIGRKLSPEHVAAVVAGHLASGAARTANIRRWAAMTPERRAEIGRNISAGRMAKRLATQEGVSP